MMLFAVQLLMALYTISVVTSAAHEAARVVAAGSVERRDPVAVAAARIRGERRLRQLLGRFGDRVRLDWSASDDESVVLRVQAETPHFAIPGLSGAGGLDRVDRTVRVRVERLR